MEKITSVSGLPDFFRNRVYRKNLSDIDWFREIRRREKISSFIGMVDRAGVKTSEELRKSMLFLLEKEEVRSDSLIYLVPQDGLPVQDLTVGEAAFFGHALLRPEISELVKDYEKLLRLWSDVLKEEKETAPGGPDPTFGQYERELASYVERLDDDMQERLNTPIYQYSDHLGNPWLSYGRPLNGFPLTIDTQFDDETILQHFKLWLSQKRKEESSTARRRFNQNDFDDWTFYKVREIFDLETWAKICNVKIQDKVMAAALWPNAPDSISPIDVIRTTARKKVKELFQFDTVVRFYGQLRLEHGENFLVE